MLHLFIQWSDPEELQTLLAQLGAVMRSYGKGEALVLAGEPNRRVGIVLSGELEAYRPGPQGARIPITTWSRAACSAMC